MRQRKPSKTPNEDRNDADRPVAPNAAIDPTKEAMRPHPTAPLGGRVPTAGAVPAFVALAMAGVPIERWLFFAEATHTVMLYYGAATA